MRGVKDPQIVNLEASGAVVTFALVHKTAFASTSRISVAPSVFFLEKRDPQMGRPFAGQ